MPSRQFSVISVKSLFDELIDRHAEAYMEEYPEVKEFSNFEKSGTFNYYIGMVWTNDYERPDLGQLRIRGSQELSKNKILELDLSSIDSQQSFFPGQIVAFLADPFLKRQLTVTKFLDPMRIAPTMKTINIDSKINLMIASGPYMTPESEDWSLFTRIIDETKSNQVTHLILIGPFVDLENKHLRHKYDVNWRFVFDKLVEGLHDHQCHIYLVPSNRDVLPSYLNGNYFYPCEQLDVKLHLKAGVKPKCTIRSVPDPSQIDLGGLYLDVTSAEVLFHLYNCTRTINKGPGNLYMPMFRSIVTQGIYPIHPSPTDMAVDYPKLKEFLTLDRLGPHIIVLPSKFNTTCNNVDNRLVVTVQKCSTRKQAMLIEIPKIESSAEGTINSVVICDYTHRLVNLSDTVKKEPTKVEALETRPMESQES